MEEKRNQEKVWKRIRTPKARLDEIKRSHKVEHLENDEKINLINR